MTAARIDSAARVASAARRLAGKRALVTAAAQGIGRATAELFAAHGCDVLATDVNVAALSDINGCRTARLDVRDASAIESMVADAGNLDILFNCAGIVVNGTVLECSDAQWAESLELNVTSMFRLIRAVLPGMLSMRAGCIINMASVASSIKGVPNRCVYGASKAAVIGLTKSVAADFVAHGIRCNAICPGTVDTPSLHERLKANSDYARNLQAFVARQPMGRLGTPEEVAAMALYLACDEAAFITGQCYAIDGGWTI